MVIDSHGEHLLGCLLSYHVLVEKLLNLLRLQQIDAAEINALRILCVAQLLLQNLRAQLNTVVTDIYAVGTGDHLSYLILRFPAEGTSDIVVLSAWHSPTSTLSLHNQRPVMTRSMRPYFSASSAVI